jgi:23S rRNA (guanosine2251-2'-O)-methyltransferase
VRSLQNVGAIIRVADAARVERLYLCGMTGYPPTADDPRPSWVAERAGRLIAKTALAAIDQVPWEYRASAIEPVGELKARGAQIVALERTERSVDYVAARYEAPLCVIVGHERVGISDLLLDLADLIVEIPMHGYGASLNVATAFGIWVYEVLRRDDFRRLSATID